MLPCTRLRNIVRRPKLWRRYVLAVAVGLILGLLVVEGASRATVTVNFGKSTLFNETSRAPTSLQFGPDGRLYVAQQDGRIKIYTIQRNGANYYAVVDTEAVKKIRRIPNHDDDGSLNTSIKNRLVTGILVAGTQANPVIYVTSSDPRSNRNNGFQDTNLDTNSGVLSRLTWTGTRWKKRDLIRGLPRSERDHAPNGLELNSSTNTLYIAQGGNTSEGAPSTQFALLPEYALSAAVLEVDLDAIGNTTYDLPTLDDDTRTGEQDANDPFGGNDGKNQARLVADGPVQVYAPGFRNAYDLLITESGKMYTADNNGGASEGGRPVNEGPDGTCTNDPNEVGTEEPETLHLIEGAGYYGGHPNPTRGNKANTFNADGQSPVPSANPVECDYRASLAKKGALTKFDASTNGLTEYTASNFGGAMKGNLLAASFDNSIYRIELNDTGDGVVLKKSLFSNVGTIPLDVTAQSDTGRFPGTIWVADIRGNTIVVFEPGDYAS